MTNHEAHPNNRFISRLAPVLLTIGLAAVLGGLLYNHSTRIKQLEQAALLTDVSLEKLSIFHDGQHYVLRDDLKTVLLIGIDKEDTDEQAAGQCDFVTLAVFDLREDKWTLLQLNRDTMCPITMLSATGEYQGTENAQLALAHAYGSGGTDSCRNTVQAVENLLFGVPIHDYIRIDISNIAQFNDAVGGVRVFIRDDFSALDPRMTIGSEITLEGTQAELFVRARKSMDDPTNLNRMARQRDYMYGWIEAALQTDTEALMKPMAKSLYTSLSMQHLESIVKTAKNDSLPEIRTLPGEARMGKTYVEFYADDEALKSIMIDLFFEKE